MMPKDTIFALSSGAGRSGVAVIRISGPAAGPVLDMMAGGRGSSRHFRVRKILGLDGELIDRGISVWLPGPATVTGEDMAEFHVHGSPAVTSKIFAELLQFENIRPALAGEFSRRAFENGKMDLVEVEGLADLLAAETEAQRKLAMRQYMGVASDIYEEWRLRVLESLAYAEASIDFVDEEGVAEQSLSVIRPKLLALVETLEDAERKADRASAVRRGLSVVIAGAPNAGKSSLVNALAEREVSIVSPIAGTTRDVVADVVMLGGVPVRMVDTAGLRSDTADGIEVEGIRRATAELAAAAVLVWLEACNQTVQVLPPREADVFVHTKSDLTQDQSIRMRDDGSLYVSVVTGAGLNVLRETLAELIRARLSAAEDGTMVRARHAASVKEALTHLKSALSYEAEQLELLAEDVRKAAKALASITGRVDVEDVLGQIFSEFCIGK
jgi:tRNA modification GTPase